MDRGLVASGSIGLVLMVLSGACGRHPIPKAPWDARPIEEAGSIVDTPADRARDLPTIDLAITPDVPVTNNVRRNGESCTTDTECASSFCVSGFCCTTRCDDHCMACNIPTRLGTCMFIPSGASPIDPLHCPKETPESCGLDGTCDGKGGCRVYLAGVACSVARCISNDILEYPACNGMRGCGSVGVMNCAPYACNAKIGSCHDDCADDTQCADRNSCVAGRCVPGRASGECSFARECLSGFCVDGVCCDAACDGPCVTCNRIGSIGTCTLIPSEEPAKPKGGCTPDPAKPCGSTGVCDGRGQCALAPKGTTCPSVCTGESTITQRSCDGRGACAANGLTATCLPYACDSASGQCLSSCDSLHPCLSGLECVNGRCGHKVTEQPCKVDNDCKSGHCVQGTCSDNDASLDSESSN